MGTLPAEIRQFFVKEGIAGRLIVAVSGGIDSTALLLALTFVDDDSVRPVAAHVNHHLRGAESDEDETFVRELCARLTAIRGETNARFVATAHQKNDQAETVLMRLLTGSGIAGLRGIHPVREDGFIRPMLNVTRDDIEAFLRDEG